MVKRKFSMKTWRFDILSWTSSLWLKVSAHINYMIEPLEDFHNLLVLPCGLFKCRTKFGVNTPIELSKETSYTDEGHYEVGSAKHPLVAKLESYWRRTQVTKLTWLRQRLLKCEALKLHFSYLRKPWKFRQMRHSLLNPDKPLGELQKTPDISNLATLHLKGKEPTPLLDDDMEPNWYDWRKITLEQRTKALVYWKAKPSEAPKNLNWPEWIEFRTVNKINAVVMVDGSPKSLKKTSKWYLLYCGTYQVWEVWDVWWIIETTFTQLPGVVLEDSRSLVVVAAAGCIADKALFSRTLCYPMWIFFLGRRVPYIFPQFTENFETLL